MLQYNKLSHKREWNTEKYSASASHIQRGWTYLSSSKLGAWHRTHITHGSNIRVSGHFVPLPLRTLDTSYLLKVRSVFGHFVPWTLRTFPWDTSYLPVRHFVPSHETGWTFRRDTSYLQDFIASTRRQATTKSGRIIKIIVIKVIVKHVLKINTFNLKTGIPSFPIYPETSDDVMIRTNVTILNYDILNFTLTRTFTF